MDDSEHLAACLDHTEVPFGVCSYSRNRRRAENVFDNKDTAPLLNEANFQIFTEFRVHNNNEQVYAYRPSSYPLTAIRLRGDKGTVSRLYQKPTILFDDGEPNLEVVRNSHPWSEGVHVGYFLDRRDRRRREQIFEQWMESVNNFAARVHERKEEQARREGHQ